MGNTYLLFTFVISLGVIIALILSKKLNPSLCLFIGAIVAAVIGRVDFSSLPLAVVNHHILFVGEIEAGVAPYAGD